MTKLLNIRQFFQDRKNRKNLKKGAEEIQSAQAVRTQLWTEEKRDFKISKMLYPPAKYDTNPQNTNDSSSKREIKEERDKMR
jgi:hypothetical protein